MARPALRYGRQATHTDGSLESPGEATPGSEGAWQQQRGSEAPVASACAVAGLPGNPVSLPGVDPHPVSPAPWVGKAAVPRSTEKPGGQGGGRDPSPEQGVGLAIVPVTKGGGGPETVP